MKEYTFEFMLRGYTYPTLVRVRERSQDLAHAVAWRYAENVFGRRFNPDAGVWLREERRIAA